jgi:hypothetical protein
VTRRHTNEKQQLGRPRTTAGADLSCCFLLCGRRPGDPRGNTVETNRALDVSATEMWAFIYKT